MERYRADPSRFQQLIAPYQQESCDGPTPLSTLDRLMVMPALLTTKHVAELLGKSDRWIRDTLNNVPKQMQHGLVPPMKKHGNGQWYILRDAMLQWLENWNKL